MAKRTRRRKTVASAPLSAVDGAESPDTRRSRTRTPAAGIWADRSFLIGAALLLLATVIAYMPAFECGYIWDDDTWVTDNTVLRVPDALFRIWFRPPDDPQYYPLTLTTFWLEGKLWGLAPAGYHVVNVILHVISAVLLWILLRRLEVRGSWIAAAIFALHPVHVESVAWITERKNVLSGMFYLAAAITYLRFDTTKPRNWRLYGAALLLFLAALFSKTVASSLPAAILLVIWWKRGRIEWRDIVPLIPWFVIGAVLGMHTAWIEKHQVGAQGEPWDLSLIERTLIAGRALWFYAGKLAWPANIMFNYPRWNIDAHAWWQYLYPLAAAITVVVLWLLRHRIGRGPLIAVLFFCGALFPALGYVDIFPMQFSFVADHFQYLASIGLIALFAAVIARLVPAEDDSKRPRPTPPPPFAPRLAWVVVPVLLCLGVLTWRQTHIYADEPTLWKDTIKRNPRAWMPYCNLGVYHAAQGDLDSAMGHYRKSMRINPRYPDTYYNMGNALVKLGRDDEATTHYAEAVRLRPDLYRVYYNWGNLLMRQDKPAEAAKRYRKAIAGRPDHAEYHNNLGNALSRLQDAEDAEKHYREAIRNRPGYADAYNNLGALMLQLGRKEDAVRYLRRALKLAPNNVRARKNLEMAQQLPK